MAADDDLLLEI